MAETAEKLAPMAAVWAELLAAAESGAAPVPPAGSPDETPPEDSVAVNGKPAPEPGGVPGRLFEEAPEGIGGGVRGPGSASPAGAASISASPPSEPVAGGMTELEPFVLGENETVGEADAQAAPAGRLDRPATVDAGAASGSVPASPPERGAAAAVSPLRPGGVAFQQPESGPRPSAPAAEPEPTGASPAAVQGQRQEANGTATMPPAPAAPPLAERHAEGAREVRPHAAANGPQAPGELLDRVSAGTEADTGRQDGSGHAAGEKIENPFAKTEIAAADDGAAPSQRFELELRDGRPPQGAESPAGRSAEAHGAAREREAAAAGAQRAGVFEQIVQRSAAHVHQSGGEIRIDLKPEHLGHVRMQILTEHQQVTVRILTELPAVRELIESGLPQLKSDLQQQGLQVERLEVAVSDDPRQHPGRRAHHPGARRRAPLGGISAAEAASAAGPAAPATRGGRFGTATVDMFV